MTAALPFRSRDRNSARALAAPAAFVVLASRPRGADATEIVLRDEIVADPGRVRWFAGLVLQAAVRRHGAGCDVQVIDGAGAPVYFATMAGGAS